MWCVTQDRLDDVGVLVEIRLQRVASEFAKLMRAGIDLLTSCIFLREITNAGDAATALPRCDMPGIEVRSTEHPLLSRGVSHASLEHIT